MFGEDKRGDELSPGFQSQKERLQRIREAKEQLEKKQKQRQQKYQRNLKEREQKEKESGKKLRDQPPPRGRILSDLSYKDRMERKLSTKKGKQVYKTRSTSVEPSFGQIQNRGLGRLLLRGLRKGRGEWSLMCLSYNLLKLWKAQAH